MPKIYIHYAAKDNTLFISSYHEKVQSKLNAFSLVRTKDLKSTDLQSLEGDLPESYDNEVVKDKLLELLTEINNMGLEFATVIYRGDLNLCTKRKDDLATYLFDGTVDRFFAGKEVQFILESANKEYVEGAIDYADRIGLTNAVIQTKSGTPKGQELSKTYPKQEPAMDVSVPKPKASELAQSSVTVQDSRVLSDALGKFGSFSPASAETNSAPTKKQDVEGTEETPGLTN
ncbi:hypothetical protein OQJ13_12850 [Legionella sp. PATHC035]|uniref:hypothetical protein n=1 Tax=Legionella sp. PATHC035 TaxID=2992040 RepID=UPI0022439CAF|nr:hypothetical protein [Legionella sp. PATHC035]MCW8409860.1 hypothetical protein [Legionella sp. PATHC035]